MTDETAARVWRAAGRMALDGCSALEDLVESGALPPEEFAWIIELAIRRLAKVKAKVRRAQPSTDSDAG